MGKKSSALSQPAGLKQTSSAVIEARQWTESERLAMRQAAQLQAAGDDAGIDLLDLPSLTQEQLDSLVRLRDSTRRIPVSVRLDPRVVDWLKSKGKGHLTLINDILTNLMEAEDRRFLR